MARIWGGYTHAQDVNHFENQQQSALNVSSIHYSGPSRYCLTQDLQKPTSPQPVVHDAALLRVQHCYPEHEHCHTLTIKNPGCSA
jgi:hypothetical protein